MMIDFCLVVTEKELHIMLPVIILLKTSIIFVMFLVDWNTENIAFEPKKY